MKIWLLCLFAAGGSLAGATTVNLSSTSNGPSVYDISGSLIFTGLIRVGTLTTPDDINSFVEFGTSTIKAAGVGTSMKPSKVVGAVLNTNGESDDAFFNNRDIYVWIYDAATAAGSTQNGLFRAVGQTFPVNNPDGVEDAAIVPATSLTVSVDDPRLPCWAPAQFNGQLPANTDGTGVGRIILGFSCPEPSSAGLLALAGMFAGRRRRCCILAISPG